MYNTVNTIPKAIVIASGNSVLDNEYGKYINHFRHVMRFMGYEKAVDKEKFIGTKIDSYIFNLSEDAVEIFEILSKNNTVPCNRLLVHGSFPVPEREARITNAAVGKNYFIDKIKFSDIARVRQALLLDDIYPSSGIMAIDYLLKQYDTVCVYGFDKFVYGNKNDASLQKHFFEKENYAPSLDFLKTRHDYDREAVYLNALEQAGKIVKLKTLVENGLFAEQEESPTYAAISS